MVPFFLYFYSQLLSFNVKKVNSKTFHLSSWTFFHQIPFPFTSQFLNRFPASLVKLIIRFPIFIHHTLYSINWISSLLPSPYFLGYKSLLWVKYWNTNVIKALKWQKVIVIRELLVYVMNLYKYFIPCLTNWKSSEFVRYFQSCQINVN